MWSHATKSTPFTVSLQIIEQMEAKKAERLRLAELDDEERDAELEEMQKQVIECPDASVAPLSPCFGL